MKFKLISLVSIVFIVFACTEKPAQIISTPSPKRANGQTDVLQLAVDPIPVVRVAFIGLGMRGPSAVKRMTYMDGVEIVALCDMEEENVKKTNEILVERGFPKALEFYGDAEIWREVSALPNVDLLYVATDWLMHATIGIQGMLDGKHVALEVPGGLTMDEIWKLVDTAEQTRKHCMMLENCVYDFFELTTLNMAQEGLFGEILHAEGAYIHGLNPYWDKYWNNWRLDYNLKHRGDLYPTHGLGPVCQALNIHRGDKMNYLVSVDTKAVGNVEFIEEKGEKVENFRNGEHTNTLIKTEKGKTILIEHNVTSPRPYSRMYQLTGTKGFANKYPMQGYYISPEKLYPDSEINHENLTSHNFISTEERTALMEKYKHPIAKDIEEKAKQVGGHGGMDFIMDYRLIYCLQNGLPLDMDVYDMAEWSCLVPLTEISLDNNSAPVEIPDFTRGAWDKLDKLEFAQ